MHPSVVHTILYMQRVVATDPPLLSKVKETPKKKREHLMSYKKQGARLQQQQLWRCFQLNLPEQTLMHDLIHRHQMLGPQIGAAMMGSHHLILHLLQLVL